MAFRSSTGLAYSSRTTCSFTVPSSVASGDGIVVSWYVESTTRTVSSVPSGFTLAGTAQTSAASTWIHRVYVKQATGSDTGTYDFVLSGAANTMGACGAYSGRSTGTLLDGTVQQGTLNGVTQPPSLTLTTSLAGTDLVYLVMDFNNGEASAVVTNFTNRQASADGYLLCDWVNKAAGGYTVQENAQGSDQWTCFLLGLAVATAATPIPDVTMAPRIPN